MKELIKHLKVIVYYELDMGIVTGAGFYQIGEVTLTATAKDGYKFISWSDRSDDESSTLTITVYKT